MTFVEMRPAVILLLQCWTIKIDKVLSMIYFCSKRINSTTLILTKIGGWPTLKLGFIPPKVYKSTPFTLVNSMMMSKRVKTKGVAEWKKKNRGCFFSNRLLGMD